MAAFPMLRRESRKEGGVVSFVSVLVFGFLLGLRHAFEADHLVAVSTLVTSKRSVWKSIRFGVIWGVGHSATLLAVGGVVLILQVRIPPFLELSLEGLVGAMLVGLGLMTLLDCRRRRIHLHQHTHAGTTHLHFHTHAEVQNTSINMEGKRAGNLSSSVWSMDWPAVQPCSC